MCFVCFLNLEVKLWLCTDKRSGCFAVCALYRHPQKQPCTKHGEVHTALQGLEVFLSSATQIVSRHKNSISSSSLGYVGVQFWFSDEDIQYLATSGIAFFYSLHFWLRETNLPVSCLLIERLRTWHAHCCLAMLVSGFELKLSLLLKITHTNKTLFPDILRWSHFLRLILLVKGHLAQCKNIFKGQVFSCLFLFSGVWYDGFESLWLIRLQWFMSKKCIFSKAQASSATGLWILVKFVNSSALPGTVLGKRTEMLV